MLLIFVEVTILAIVGLTVVLVEELLFKDVWLLVALTVLLVELTKGVDVTELRLLLVVLV